MEPNFLPGGYKPGKYRILFAGGCHLDKTTPENYTTLSTVAMGILAECGIACDPEYLIQVRLAHSRRVAQKCVEFQPDILVLQAGHPETASLVGGYLVRRFGLDRYREQVSRSASSAPLPFDSFKDRLKWRLRSAVKTAFHYASGRRLLDVEDFERKLARFFERVAATHVPRVIVLSPLPCADPVPMYYRRVIAPLLRAAASRFGFEYVDVIDLGNSAWHRDPTHLGPAGHRILGETLGRFLVCSLLRRADAASPPESDLSALAARAEAAGGEPLRPIAAS